MIIALENSTSEFIMEFDQLDSSRQSVIPGAVQHPIHDGFNLQNIYNNIAGVNTSSPTKQELLAARIQAAQGQNAEIK